MAHNRFSSKINEVLALVVFMVVIMGITYLFLSFCNWGWNIKDWNGFSRFIFGAEGIVFLIKILSEQLYLPSKTWVESIVFTLAFNYLAPKVNEIYLTAYTWELPFVHVGYWHVFAFFIVIHYIGTFIQHVTPKIVNVNNNNNCKEK